MFAKLNIFEYSNARLSEYASLIKVGYASRVVICKSF